MIKKIVLGKKMRQEYNKLVRDRIPEIIRQNGSECEVVTLSSEEYRQALRSKLIEEATEAARSSDGELGKELADLYEVIDALMLSYGIDRDMVRYDREQKLADRGGFEGRIKLLWVE